MKQNYASQFKSNFVTASSETAIKPTTSVAVPNAAVYKRDPKDAEDKKEKKSRWGS
jgi:hypothetical protein